MSRRGRTSPEDRSNTAHSPLFSSGGWSSFKCRNRACYLSCTSAHKRCFNSDPQKAQIEQNFTFMSSRAPVSGRSVFRYDHTSGSSGSGMAGHTRSLRVGNEHHKARLLASVLPQTTTLSSGYSNFSKEHTSSCPPHRSTGSAGKGGYRESSRCTKRVRVLQPLLPRSEEGRRLKTHFRSQASEQSPHDTAVQNAYNQTHPGANSPRRLVLFSGSKRRVLSHPSEPPPQAILEIRLRGADIPVHSSTFWTGTGTSYVHEMHGCSSLPPETAGNAHPELPRRLAHFDSVRGGVQYSQSLASQSFRMPGAQGELLQEYSVPQSAYHVPGNSSRLRTYESVAHFYPRSLNPTARRVVHEGHSCTPSNVSEDFGPYGFGSFSTPTRSTAHASSSAVASTSGTPSRLAYRYPEHQGGPALHSSTGPLDERQLVSAGREHGSGLRKEGHFDRCLQLRLGSPVRGQACLRPLVELGETPTHKLPRDESSFSGPKNLPSTPGRTPYLGPDGQHVSGVLHKSPGRSQIPQSARHSYPAATLGSDQSALAQSSSRAGHVEYRSRHALSGQRSPRGMVSPPPDSSPIMGNLRTGRGRPLRLRRQLSLPNLLFEEKGRAGPRLAQSSPLRVSSGLDAASGHRTDQEHGVCDPLDSSSLAVPILVPRADAAVSFRPLANSSEERLIGSSEQKDMAPPSRLVGPSCLAAQRLPQDLPEGVLNTILEARAPSTRRLYHLKWSVFSSWCQARNLDPHSCEVPLVLSFLQELLDAGRSPSTLKVYVAAIAAFHVLVAGSSLGKCDLIVRFLKGARRLNPPRPPSVPAWDLSLVLRALKGPPFEPLGSTDLKSLSLKTALLLALASVKRVGDLHALSISASCLEFGPNDSKVLLKPKHGYVPKVLSTPFRAQVISLSALPVSGEDSDAHTLCPVRALRLYLERSASFRQSEQLFVCFGGRTKGLPVTKLTLSRWIVDAIALAYTSLGLPCPMGVRAHSTRGIASSWAWTSGVSIEDICAAAGWSAPSTFARFYNLEVPALQARVLSI